MWDLSISPINPKLTSWESPRAFGASLKPNEKLSLGACFCNSCIDFQDFFHCHPAALLHFFPRVNKHQICHVLVGGKGDIGATRPGSGPGQKWFILPSYGWRVGGPACGTLLLTPTPRASLVLNQLLSAALRNNAVPSSPPAAVFFWCSSSSDWLYALCAASWDGF